MNALLEFGQLYGWWVTLILFVAWAIYQERGRILTFVGRRQKMAEDDARADRNFDQATRERLLSNGEYSRELVDRILAMYDTERRERVVLSKQLLSAATATERITVEAIETMKSFVDIARIQADRQNARDAELIEVLNEAKKVMAATWFVLVRLHGAKPSEAPSSLNDVPWGTERGKE